MQNKSESSPNFTYTDGFKYALSSIAQTWNPWIPWNWSFHMKLAAGVALLGYLVPGGDTRSIDTNSNPNPFFDWLKTNYPNYPNQNLILRMLDQGPEAYIKDGKHIKHCLRDLSNFPIEVLPINKKLLKHTTQDLNSLFNNNFELKIIPRFDHLAEQNEQNQALDQFNSVVWAIDAQRFDEFNVVLRTGCHLIEEAKNILSNIFIDTLGMSLFKIVGKSTHCEKAITGCNTLKKGFFDGLSHFLPQETVEPISTEFLTPDDFIIVGGLGLF